MASVTNIAAGPRGLHSLTGLVLIEPGATVTVDLSDAERASAEKTGYFEFDPADDEPADDLSDLTVAGLTDVAKAEGIDLGGVTRKADIAAAIRAARGGSHD